MFLKACNVLEKLEEHGYEAYFVGGSIRDYLLNRTIGDIDIATSALPTEVMNLFEKNVPVGIQHGTVVVLHDGDAYEVTTFRIDDDYIDHRRPNEVKFVRSLHEDLRRRDFTMNAIAMDRKGEIIDLFQGQEAIRKKLIQTVGIADERFKEDALRMMRAVRFESQLSFEVENNTHQAITKHASLLHRISIERITVEFEKLLKGDSCHRAIRTLVSTGLNKYLPYLVDKEEELLNWPNLEYPSLQTRAELWAMVCLLLDIEDSYTFLQPWKLPTKVMKEAEVIVSGTRKVQTNGWNPWSLYEYGEELITSIERVNSLRLGYCVPSRIQNIKNQFDLLPIKGRAELMVNGRDLLTWGKRSPGPWIAERIQEIEKKIVMGELENKQEKIKEWLLQCNRL
ncbi:CCA tRNA nucleotidyltransferase [Bacillus sp. BGMRC 2118]|nr:CCA tRNA nucleotidyltransferase [Bacillus sp. BGMRC 2118]